eukprot:6173339-Pleurochrysis_carterae.AAC.1
MGYATGPRQPDSHSMSRGGENECDDFVSQSPNSNPRLEASVVRSILSAQALPGWLLQSTRTQGRTAPSLIQGRPRWQSDAHAMCGLFIGDSMHAWPRAAQLSVSR